MLATLLTEKLSPQPHRIKLSKYGMRQPVANSQTYEDTLRSIVLATLLTEKLSPQPHRIKLSKYGMRQPVANSQTYEDTLRESMSVSYSPDGKTIATASSWDKTVKIWDAATGSQLSDLRGHTEESGVLATLLTEKLSPQPHGIKLSKYGMRQPVANSQTYEDTLTGVNSVSYSPDGKTIATASWIKLSKYGMRQPVANSQTYEDTLGSQEC